VLGGLVLLVMNYFNPLAMLEKLPSVSGKLAVQGSKITMELPRIAGVTRDQRAYELTAEPPCRTSPSLTCRIAEPARQDGTAGLRRGGDHGQERHLQHQGRQYRVARARRRDVGERL
jgi:hypothetical protein